MGIMHKLFKRRDSEYQEFIMDLTKSKDNNQEQDSSDMHEDGLVPKLATEDNQFTAEHIVQLCKFLAEKSKRNKIACKRLPCSLSSPRKSKFQNQKEYQRESNSNSYQASSELVNQKEYATHNTTHVLTDIHEVNTTDEINKKNFGISNKNRYAEDKRNILLKIRHQIFERKRQRQQLDVWRPW